jgi:hypothetical protein
MEYEYRNAELGLKSSRYLCNGTDISGHKQRVFLAFCLSLDLPRIDSVYGVTISNYDYVSEVGHNDQQDIIETCKME